MVSCLGRLGETARPSPHLPDDKGCGDLTKGQFIDQEYTDRNNKRLVRLLKAARFKLAATLEDIDYEQPRGITRSRMASLIPGEWLNINQNLLISGPCGTGKSWLSCAFGHSACLRGYSVRYYRTSRLLEAMTITHGDGSYSKLLSNWRKLTC